MPRKTSTVRLFRLGVIDASMRPRPDAAENAGLAALDVARNLASMRPRPDAAENTLTTASAAYTSRGFNEAAARCRGKPPPPCRASTPARRFNEAAARCRGKPGLLAARPGPQHASMRPRPDAAENTTGQIVGLTGMLASMRPRPDAAENAATRRQPSGGASCFNEAAARCRGKPRRHPFASSCSRVRFNEAAARCRGKRPSM